jgi:hypothetical protein
MESDPSGERVLDFCHCDKIPGINNLKEIYFDS